MMRVLKNVSKANIKTIFRGREVSLPAKHSMKFLDYDEEEQHALYWHIKQTYGFVIDITDQILERDNKLKIKTKK